MTLGIDRLGDVLHSKNNCERLGSALRVQRVCRGDYGVRRHLWRLVHLQRFRRFVLQQVQYERRDRITDPAVSSVYAAGSAIYAAIGGGLANSKDSGATFSYAPRKSWR